jgi:hypothetical protein
MKRREAAAITHANKAVAGLVPMIHGRNLHGSAWGIDDPSFAACFVDGS